MKNYTAKKTDELKAGFVITTVISGKKNFVSGQFTRPDNKYLVRYTEDINQAKPFLSQTEADYYKRNIHNTLNRVFTVEPAMLPAASFRPAAFTSFRKEKIA